MHLLFRSPSQIYLIFVSPKVCWINEPFTPFTPFTPRNKAILDVWLKLVISQEEQIFQFPHYPFPQNYTLCTKQSKQYHFYEKVCMSSSSTHVVVREGRDCLAPAASPGVASSDIIQLYCWPPFCPNHHHHHAHQLCPTLCDFLQHFLPGKTFLQTVHGRWDRRCSEMSQVSHISANIQLWSSGFLTHVHKSTGMKRKTGLILDEPWVVWTCPKLIFFGCQLENWS